MKTRFLLLVISAAVCFAFSVHETFAGDAVWSTNPRSDDWNTAENWTPNTVPNGSTDVATFSTSRVTKPLISTYVDLDTAYFDSNASAFTVKVDDVLLTFIGVGVINDSGMTQSFDAENNGGFSFMNSATAGEGTSFYGPSAQFFFEDSSSAAKANIAVTGTRLLQGHLFFFDNSSASEATINITNNAYASFNDNSTAANATFDVNGSDAAVLVASTADHASVTCSYGGGVFFDMRATAAEGTFTAYGATASSGLDSLPSSVDLSDDSTGGDATFVINGGSALNAPGVTMNFYERSTAGNATITANGGTNGGRGSTIVFTSYSKGDTARLILNDAGNLDIGKNDLGNVTIGSLEGNGPVYLGANQLLVGSNDLSTTFSGLIQDGGLTGDTGGALSKVGNGTLTLSGANTYPGGTTVTSGVLLASNSSGSATGSGSVTVTGGTLGGGGTISGPVTIGAGNGSGATLQPSYGTNKKVTLTIQDLLTFQSDGTYSFQLKSRRAEVVTNGLTIQSGAQFLLVAPSRKLPAGKTATVISNTSATPISGAFANLPDGGTITSGNNTFKANYHGGDGNDLTLTVQ